MQLRSVPQFALYMLTLLLVGWIYGADHSKSTCCCTGADAPALLRSRRFEVVDGNGRVRISLGVGESGEASIELRDSSQRVQVTVSAGADGKASAIVLRDALGLEGLVLRRSETSQHGTVQLFQIYHPTNDTKDVGRKLAVELGRDAHQLNHSLSITSADGSASVELGVLNLAPKLRMSARRATSRELTSSDIRGFGGTDPKVEIFDHQSGSLLFGFNHNKRPELEMRDAVGRVLWTAP
jgi:hypothetical protein